MNIIPFIAAYFFVMGLFIVFRDKQVRNWPSTEGTLISKHIGTAYKDIENFKVSDFVYEHTISAHLKYEYSVGESTYVGTRLSFSLIYGSNAVLPLIRKQFDKIESFPNGNIKIYYSPSNPKKSVLLKPDMLSGVVGWLCFPVGLFFCFLDPVVI